MSSAAARSLDDTCEFETKVEYDVDAWFEEIEGWFRDSPGRRDDQLHFMMGDQLLVVDNDRVPCHVFIRGPPSHHDEDVAAWIRAADLLRERQRYWLITAEDARRSLSFFSVEAMTSLQIIDVERYFIAPFNVFDPMTDLSKHMFALVPFVHRRMSNTKPTTASAAAELPPNDQKLMDLFNRKAHFAVLYDGEVVETYGSQLAPQFVKGIRIDVVEWSKGYQIMAQIEKIPTHVFGKIVRGKHTRRNPPDSKYSDANDMGEFWKEVVRYDLSKIESTVVKLVADEGRLTMEITTTNLKTVLHRIDFTQTLSCTKTSAHAEC